MRSDVIVPLPLYQPDLPENLAIDLRGYKHAEQFIGVLSKYRTSTLRIFDLNYLFNILIGVAAIQERLCKLTGWTESYHLKIKVLNAWRTIPYVDVPEILQRFEKYGPPMCLDSVTSLPRDSGPDNYVEVSRLPEVDSEVTRGIIQALLMFSGLALAFGIPQWIPHDNEGKVTPYDEALIDAGRRAIDVQRLRNSRANP